MERSCEKQPRSRYLVRCSEELHEFFNTLYRLLSCIKRRSTLRLHCKSCSLKNLKYTWSCIQLEWLTFHVDNWLRKASLINGFNSTVDYRGYCRKPRGREGGGRFSVHKRESEMAGYARKKISVCLWTYEIICYWACIKFLTNRKKDPDVSRKFSSLHSIEKRVLYFPSS